MLATPQTQDIINSVNAAAAAAAAAEQAAGAMQQQQQRLISPEAATGSGMPGFQPILSAILPAPPGHMLAWQGQGAPAAELQHQLSSGSAAAPTAQSSGGSAAALADGRTAPVNGEPPAEEAADASASPAQPAAPMSADDSGSAKGGGGSGGGGEGGSRFRPHLRAFFHQMDALIHHVVPQQRGHQHYAAGISPGYGFPAAAPGGLAANNHPMMMAATGPNYAAAAATAAAAAVGQHHRSQQQQQQLHAAQQLQCLQAQQPDAFQILHLQQHPPPGFVGQSAGAAASSLTLPPGALSRHASADSCSFLPGAGSSSGTHPWRAGLPASLMALPQQQQEQELPAGAADAAAALGTALLAATRKGLVANAGIFQQPRLPSGHASLASAATAAAGDSGGASPGGVLLPSTDESGPVVPPSPSLLDDIS